MKSRLFTVDTKDLVNGILVAFLAALLSGIIGLLDNGAVFTWITLKPVLIAAVSAALSYILKSMATNSHNQLFTKEPS